MEEPDELPKNSICYACLCKNDEKQLYIYTVQNESLKTIFQVNQLCLCFLCKRLVQKLETFIQNVQNNQILLENFENITNSAVQAIESSIHSVNDLTYFQLKTVQLGHDDSNEESFTVLYNTWHKDVKVKQELKSEDEFDLEFGGIDFNNIKLEEEDEHPLKKLKQELELEGINIKCLKSKRKRKSKFGVKKKIKKVKLEGIKESGITRGLGLGIKIDSFLITKQQCMEEREELSKSPVYTNSTYKCQFCIKGFTFKGSYDVHMEKHSKTNGDFECDVCKLRMDSADKLEMHQKYHRVRYRCPECNLVRKNSCTIRDHYTAHHGNGAYEFMCPRCLKTFKRHTSLRKHINTVHNKTRLICDYCKKSYSGKEGLRNHMVLLHPSEVSPLIKNQKKYVCNECGKESPSPSHLKLHVATHAKTRDYYCVECDKSFKTESVLKQHYRIAFPHVKYSELPVVCENCDKRFRNRRDRDRHINKDHLHVKPYQCDQCDKAYVRSECLTKHRKKVHEGYVPPRNYACTMCDKMFNQKAILKSHIRTHTGERPYQCSKCPAQFTQSGVLGTHMKMVHLKLTRDGRPKHGRLEFGTGIGTLKNGLE